MANAYKCDFCGTFYEGSRTKNIIVGMSPSCCTDNVNRYDVCPDCVESFYFWKESRNRDYKTAFEDKEDPAAYGNLFDGD